MTLHNIVLVHDLSFIPAIHILWKTQWERIKRKYVKSKTKRCLCSWISSFLRHAFPRLTMKHFFLTRYHKRIWYQHKIYHQENHFLRICIMKVDENQDVSIHEDNNLNGVWIFAYVSKFFFIMNCLSYNA